MIREERVSYLGNVAQVAGEDGEISEEEGRAIERVRKEIGASREELAEALRDVGQGEHETVPVGRFSDRVRNLEDLVLVSLCDGLFSGTEKPEVLSFARQVGVSQVQLNEILAEARKRLQPGTVGASCPACGRPLPPNSKFCPKCGEDLRR